MGRRTGPPGVSYRPTPAGPLVAVDGVPLSVGPWEPACGTAGQVVLYQPHSSSPARGGFLVNDHQDPAEPAQLVVFGPPPTVIDVVTALPGTWKLQW